MTDTFRELDRSFYDRIDLRLLWRARDDRVIVAVADDKPASASASRSPTTNDVFPHPFAYAAGHPVQTRDVQSEPVAELPLCAA